jgi:hypothetical protein
MLVFFDPWHAGVVLPSFIIVGLIVIPYIDINPHGNGYYCFNARKFEILTFFLGFHILWISLIIIGTFLRGPGWNWFWPWQVWDAHKVEAMTNVDLPYLLALPREATEQPAGPLLKARATRNVSVQLKVPPQAPSGQQYSINVRAQTETGRLIGGVTFLLNVQN